MKKQLRENKAERSNWIIYRFFSKAFIVLSFMSLIFLSCDKEQTIELPLPESLLQEVEANNANCICGPYINEYKRSNKTIYVLAYTGPACNWVPAYYDVNGNKIEMAQGVSFDEFLRQSIFIRNVWTCR